MWFFIGFRLVDQGADGTDEVQLVKQRHHGKSSFYLIEFLYKLGYTLQVEQSS